MSLQTRHGKMPQGGKHKPPARLVVMICFQMLHTRRESRALEKRRISKNLFRRMVQARQGKSDNHFHYERHNTVLIMTLGIGRGRIWHRKEAIRKRFYLLKE